MAIATAIAVAATLVAVESRYAVRAVKRRQQWTYGGDGSGVNDSNEAAATVVVIANVVQYRR